MDGNLNHVDLNQCIRVAPQPVFDEGPVGTASSTFHPPHPISSSSPTHHSSFSGAALSGKEVPQQQQGGQQPEASPTYSMEQVRANLELLQRKHSEKRRKAEEQHRHAQQQQLSGDMPAVPAAELTEFGKNRPSSGLTPTFTSLQASPSPTSFPHRMIDGIDLSNREALNELSLSTVQRLHDKLRDQILTEMQVELNESQTFDQVVKQGFQELELKKRQLSHHETLSQAEHSLPPSISTISAASSRVPSHESVHYSSGSFTDDALSLPPSHPIHTRSSSSNSSIQSSSPSPASAVTSSKPRHLSVAVPKEDFISPPPLSTHSHPHSTRHGASNAHSTRSNHSAKQFVSPHPHIPQHHESQASYVRQLLTNNPRDGDHLHPGVKAIVDIISPKASPAASALSSRASQSQSFRFGVPAEHELINETGGIRASPRVNSPLYASGTSSHRFDRFLSSDNPQQQQQPQSQQQNHYRSASTSSTSSSTSTSSQAKFLQQQAAASVPGTSVNSAVTPSSSIPFTALTRVRTPHDGFRQSFAMHPSGGESGAPISASHVIRTSSSPSTGSPPSGSDYYATPSPPSMVMPQRPPPLHSTGSPMAGSMTSIASPVPVGPPPSGKRRWSPLKERGRASHTPSPSSARLQQQLLNASPTPSSMGNTLLFPAQPQQSAPQPTLIYAVPVTPGSEMALPPGGEFFYAMPAPISATNGASTPLFAAPPPYMMPPLSTTAAGSVPSSSFDWNVAPLQQVFTPTSSSPILVSPSPPHHQSSGGSRVRFSPMPPSQPRPQSESLARRVSAASPSAAHDQQSPPALERSKTAGHVPSGNGLGATPTSAARMKRMKSVGAAIASMPSPQSAQEGGITSPHVPHSAAPLQLGNWTQMQNSGQQSLSVNTNSAAVAAAASYTARASPTNKGNGKLFSSSSIAHAPHPSTARHHASGSANHQQPRMSSSRAAIESQFANASSSSSLASGTSKSNKTVHGKFHPGNAISTLKARRVAEKEKAKSQKQHVKADGQANSRARIGVPSLSLEAFDSHRTSGDLPSAIAEGDEVAAAALSARLASMGLGSGSSIDSARSGVGGKKSHKSPQMGSRYFSSPRKASGAIASDFSHLEIEEEASLAGMEHGRTDSPIPYPPSNESRTTTTDEEIEEEEHLRHGQYNSRR